MTQSANNRWIFDLNRLQNSPSKRDGMGQHEELLFRQKGTSLIKDMSQQLKLRPICMNTAIVYFHRFFALRSFKRFDVYRISVCSLFLSAKFEEQPIFKEHIIKLWFHCRQKVITNESYQKECERLVENENEMLLTFGFDLQVIHFQTVICTASDPNVINKNIQRNAYFIAGDLLRLTTICLQFSANFAACVCIHLASTLLDLPISATNWCQTIDPEINLCEVEREALEFKSFVNMSRLSVEEKKKGFNSSNSQSSPESAYSSGSGNSPVFEDRSKSSLISSDRSKDRKSNHCLPQINANHKRIRAERSSSSSLGKSSAKSSSKTNSLTNSHNLIKTKVLSNSTQSAVKREISGVHNNQMLSHRLKYQKVVKPNGEVTRMLVQTNSSAQLTLNSTANNSSSAVKETTHSKTSIENSIYKKINKINLKITITNNDLKTSDSSERIVEPILQKSSSIVKIES